MSSGPQPEESNRSVADEVSVQTPDSALRHPGQLVAAIAHDIWTGRELAWRMFLRNIRGLYRQTFLGLFWAFLPPIANTAVWVVLRKAKAISFGDNLEEVSYAVYVMTGMVIWQSFVEAFQAPMTAVKANRNMLSKLRFPREAILLVQLLEVLFNLGIRSIVLIPLLIFFGTAPFSSAMLMAPVLVLLLIVLAFAMGLFVMPFGMLYQDVDKMILVSVPVWMILTPIIYQPPENWVANPLNYLNPASPLLSVARDLLVFGESDYWINITIYAVIALPLLFAGLLLFRLAMPVLVERIST